MPSQPRSKNCILFATHAIQIFWESKYSITSCILPDPDTFAIHIGSQSSIVTTYGLQKCLGLQTCDAEWRIMRMPQLTAQHDKFLTCYVLSIQHEKLCFCMTENWSFWITCMTDLRVMIAEHDKLPRFQTQTLLQLIRQKTSPRAGRRN